MNLVPGKLYRTLTDGNFYVREDFKKNEYTMVYIKKDSLLMFLIKGDIYNNFAGFFPDSLQFLTPCGRAVITSFLAFDRNPEYFIEKT